MFFKANLPDLSSVAVRFSRYLFHYFCLSAQFLWRLTVHLEIKCRDWKHGWLRLCAPICRPSALSPFIWVVYAAYRLLFLPSPFYCVVCASDVSLLVFRSKRLPAKFVCVTAGTVWNSVAGRSWFVRSIWLFQAFIQPKPISLASWRTKNGALSNTVDSVSWRLNFCCRLIIYRKSDGKMPVSRSEKCVWIKLSVCGFYMVCEFMTAAEFFCVTACITVLLLIIYEISVRERN